MPSDQFRLFNCYHVLHISSAAGPQEIKIGWRAASMKSHPDRGGSNEAQQRVNIAYEILSDPIQRRQHDVFWKIIRTKNSREDHYQESAQRTRPKPAYSEARAEDESLSAFQSRLDSVIKTRKAEIWSQLNSRTELQFKKIKRQYQDYRNSIALWMLVALGGGCITFFKPVFWFAAVVPLLVLGIKSLGSNLAGKKISFFRPIADETFRSLANEAAAKSCHNDASQFDKYSGYFASILDLALRPSSFDDSEAQVARRLVVAFFFSGYVPETYDSQNRILTFGDGDEKIAVRFRHRSGSAVNIAYLRGLHDRMGSSGMRGFLFCSPGLSGNAADYATQHGIRWYTLETMNTWIDQMLNEGAVGPKGDILKHIDTLQQFLGRITVTVGYSRRSKRYRRSFR